MNMKHFRQLLRKMMSMKIQHAMYWLYYLKKTFKYRHFQKRSIKDERPEITAIKKTIQKKIAKYFLNCNRNLYGQPN